MGRIWTDKSVFNGDYAFQNSDSSGLQGQSILKGDNADFLVALSALSSTSNLKSTTVTTTPLDIVLVLDTSGSMDNGQGDSMGQVTVYNEIYGSDLNRRGTYYVLVDGEYVAVESYGSGGNRYWASADGTRYTPIQSRYDSDSSHVQFYERDTETVNKMQALQSAANAFVDSVAAMNDDISDPSQQHRISLVKFASNESNSVGNDTYYDREYNYRPNYSQVVSDLQPYTTSTAESLKDTINKLEGEGATRADYGLHQAQRVLDGDGSLTGARDNAQKIVIFFTDGEPTTYQSFDNEVASDAVSYAYSMKQDGTLIYSIGVVQGADPSDDPTSSNTSNINKFLQAVSSNYKNATYEWEGWGPFGSYQWSFGTRTQDANYYYAAEDASELDQVFEDITSSITQNAGSGSPIVDNSTEGNTDPGNLVFTDQLGSYMQVTGTGAGDDTIQLAYGDQVYNSTSKSTSGNVDTYHFEGTVGGNAVYGEADLADLTVEVTHSTDLATGDVLKVTIPASLIPMRNYNVDTDNGTMDVSPAYPVRLFYGVSLKADAEKALEDTTSDDYKAIIESQATDGTIDFYSNDFVKDQADGKTTAVFEPNASNKFYYFTQSADLYLDEACTQPATRSNVEGHSTLYYKDTYWQLKGSGTEAEEITNGYGTVTSGTDEWDAIDWGNRWSDQAQIPAGTQRTSRPGTLTAAKTDNVTTTAANVLNPSWSGDDEVTQALGNNGKLSFDKPGSLEIKKTVDWGNASGDTQTNHNEFKFDITVTTPTGEGGAAENLNGTYNYFVNGAKAPSGTVTFTDGKGTVTMNGGDTLVIEGLPAGASFTVIEQNANSNGFTTTDATSQEGTGNSNPNDGSVAGTIVAGSQVSLTFTNTYHASDVNLNANTTLKVQKNLTGRDWRDGDSFDFTIGGFYYPTGVSEAPEPTDTTITVDASDKDAGYTVPFGDITFSAPGEYRYTVQENSDPQQPIAGIDYSDAIYRVTVMVGDNGKGALTIDSVKIERMNNDDGTTAGTVDEGVTVDGDTMTFTNTYKADSATQGIQGKKSYTDTTDGNPFEAGKFTFKLEAQGGFVTKSGTADDLTIGAADTPMPKNAENNAITTGNVGEDFTFPSITFDGNDVGNTYVYKVTEVEGDEADKGMSYSTAEHTVMIQVEEETDDNGTHIKATVLGDYADPSKLVFENTYKPTEAKLEGDSVIHGTKTLTGREMQDDETYYFQLTAVDDNAKGVLPNAQTVKVTKDNMENGSAGFKFNDMSFTKVGTYTFTVNEVADENGTETTNGSGMTYDANIATVTVVVSDTQDGSLKADVFYSNDKHGDTTDQALFTNVYEASMNYGSEGKGGINVTKTMKDRPMTAGEFSFSIAGTNVEGSVSADEANQKLTDADRSFQNLAAGEGATSSMAKLQNMSFNQNDAGKTFSYIVDETTEDGAAQVSYDKSQYRVDIQVVDNGDGTMHTVTTVTQVKDANGNDASNVVIDKANSDTDGYTAPTFGFTNDYNPNPATVGEKASHQIQVKKTVTGADSATDYTFTLTATGDNIGNITGLDENNQLTVKTDGTIKAGESQTKTFGDLTFSEPGTYTFTVQENQPAEDAGWAFDTTARTVTVVVTDLNDKQEYDGNLYIASVTGSPVEITNSYNAEPVIVGGDSAQQQITVQKSVTGKNPDGDFNFKIEPVYDDTYTEDVWKQNVEPVDDSFDAQTAVSGVTTEQSQTATFAGIKFKATGEYKFKITEVEAHDETADPAGWTYDTHESFATVKVTDNGEGQLEAAVSYDNSQATTGADQKCSTAAAFTNSYTPGEVSTGTDANTGIQVTKEVTGHDATEAFGFSLSLAEGQDASHVFEGTGDDKTPFDGMTLTTSDDIKAGATETDTFGTITFTAAGDYTFVIDETTEKTDAGWTYDTSTHEVTVHVVDQDGKLVITKIDGNAPTFTNKYDHGTVTLSGESALKVQKTVTGAPTDVDFTFTATFDAEASSKADNPGTIAGIQDAIEGQDFALNATVSDSFAEGDAAKSASFDGVTFTQPGTYIFNVAETNATPAEGSGWTYDSTVKTITVTVTDNDSGALEAKVDYNNNVEGAADADKTVDNAAAFTNVYKASSVVVGGEDAEQQINVQKTLTGRDWQEGDSFEFVLTAQDNAPMPEGEGNKATITDASDPKTTSFGAITYDAEGTYTYTVSETKGKLGGVTYDGHSATVTVSVTDTDHDGKLEATVSYDNGEATTDADKQVEDAAAFTNTYDAGETTVDTGSADVQLTKVLEGKDWGKYDAFTFKIEAVSNTADIDIADQPMPAQTEVTVGEPTDKDANSATFSFGTIKYDTAGTYVYKVTEVPGDNSGMDYSKNEATVTVTVTDDLKGGYTTAVSIANNTFTNTYASELDFAAAGGIEIVKTFENADMREFSFKVTPKDEASAKKLGIAEAGETLTTKPGATIGDDNASHAEVMLIDPATEAKFTQDDADDTYTYTVQEVKGDSADVDYDDTVYTVTITTVDNGQGGIKVTTTVTDGAGYTQTYDYDNDKSTVDPTAVIPFTNTYKASGELGGNGSVSINATKTLTNRPMGDKEFTFNVTNANDASKTIVATGTNDASGKITFGAIKYSIDQMLDDVDNGLATPTTVGDKDAFVYTYQVTEDTTNLDNGVAAVDAAGFTITVTVVDNGDGTLGISVAYPNGGDGITFRNTYGETGQATLSVSGTKTLNLASGDNAPDIAGKYTFELTGSEGAPMPATTTAKNDASGNVSFGDITYTMENVFGDTGVQTADEDAAEIADETAGTEAEADVQSAQRSKTFTYTVTESGSVSGVTNDAEASKTFTVMVVDNGDGTLSVTSDPASGALFSFTNTYSVESTTSSPTGSGAVAITKQLTGRDLAEGEFTAVMTAADGTEVASGTNDANGTIELSAITFDKPGTYTYNLYEAVGDKGGVTYDRTQYKATATVTDNGDGTLSVEWGITTAAGDPVSAITFANTYEAASTTATLGGTKVLDGRELAEGEFQFELTAVDGAPLPAGAEGDSSTVENSANGGFAFGQIAFDQAGTYEYTISEVLPEDDDPSTDGVQKDGVTYDETAYTVEVTVADDGEGRLDVTGLTYNGEATLPVFTNTYVEPEEPATPAPGDTTGGSDEPKFAQTNDSTPWALVAGIAVVAVAAIAVGAFGLLRTRRR